MIDILASVVIPLGVAGGLLVYVAGEHRHWWNLEHRDHRPEVGGRRGR